MPTVFGRDRELREIAATLTRSRETGAAISIHASGSSGIGKSALLGAAVTGAASQGWLCAPVVSHRIQAQVPGSGMVQVIRSIVAALGDEAPRYTAGIASAVEDAAAGALAGAALHAVFLRLIEGVVLDHALLLALDDAQWFDTESGDAVEQVFALHGARPFALLVFQRTEETPAHAFRDPDESFSLSRVDPGAATEIARAHYPDAPEGVVEAIVAHAGGHPVDIVALAESARENGLARPDEIEGSLRSAIARQLGRMDSRHREFLQMCALLSEPIEYDVLQRLWPDDPHLDTLVEAASGRYLTSGSGGLRFIHSAIAESVRHTLAIEVPYRRRILKVLTARESPTMEDCERIVAQAALCGDKTLEREYLLKLANEAAKRSAISASAAAYRRALDIALPQRQEFVQFFMVYAGSLMMQNRMVEARELLERALREAREAGIEQGLGPLIFALVLATSRTLGRGPALEACDFYLQRYREPADRLHVLSVAAWVQSNRLDLEKFEAIKTELLAIADPLPDISAMRLTTAEAFLRTRLGQYEAAIPLIDRAVMHSSSVPPTMRSSPAIGRVCIEFLQFGSRNFENRISAVAAASVIDNQQIGFIDYLKATSLLGKGDLEGALELATEALNRRVELPERQRLLSICAAVTAWQVNASPLRSSIEEQLEAFFSGDQSDTLVPLAAWWAMAIAHEQPSQTRALLRRLMLRLGEPFEMDALVFPIAAVAAAVRMNDLTLLEETTASIERGIDASPWHQAQRLLATGYARQILVPGSGKEELAGAALLFDDLAYSFFSAVARIALNPADEAAAQTLRKCGVRQFKPLKESAVHAAPKKTGAAAGHPSKRELEIIRLVTDGKTNRQIAEDLFLSERTVEAHLANVFNKLSVSSRTQVAAWYLTTTAG